METVLEEQTKDSVILESEDESVRSKYFDFNLDGYDDITF